jgi:hypothetical protein
MRNGVHTYRRLEGLTEADAREAIRENPALFAEMVGFAGARSFDGSDEGASAGSAAANMTEEDEIAIWGSRLRHRLDVTENAMVRLGGVDATDARTAVDMIRGHLSGVNGQLRGLGDEARPAYSWTMDAAILTAGRATETAINFMGAHPWAGYALEAVGFVAGPIQWALGHALNELTAPAIAAVGGATATRFSDAQYDADSIRYAAMGAMGVAALGIGFATGFHIKSIASAIRSGIERLAPVLRRVTDRLRSFAVGNTPDPQGGLNLYKWGSDTTSNAAGWRAGDFMLAMPDQGSPRLNWAQNAGRLREQMRQGKPIFDSYRDPVTGMQIPSRGFLGAERNLLETRGWLYDPATGAYHPPVP